MIGQLKTVIAVTLISTTLAGFAYWRTHVREPKRLTHNASINDPSDSMVDDREKFIALVGRALNQPKLTAGSTVTVIALGDEQTANEPRLVATYDVPYSHRVIEGKSKIAKDKSSILSNLESRLEKLPRTRRSPIFAALKRAIGQLHAEGCMSDSDCSIFIRTDGAETEESAIKAAIYSVRARKDIPRLSNEGIRVAFCGLAETNSKGTDAFRRGPIHDSRPNDRIEDVWRSVFTVPSLVTFAPYCIKQELAQR